MFNCWHEDDGWIGKHWFNIASLLWKFLFENRFKTGCVKHCLSSELYHLSPFYFSWSLQMAAQFGASLCLPCPLSKSKNYYWFIPQLSLYVCFCDLHHIRILIFKKLLPFSSECVWWAYSKTNPDSHLRIFMKHFSWKHFIIYKKMCYLKKLLLMWEILTAILSIMHFKIKLHIFKWSV